MPRIGPADETELPPKRRDLLKTSMEPDELDEEYQQLLSTQRRNVHRTLAKNPTVLDTFRSAISALWDVPELTARKRELTILATASRARCRYEWHQHVRHALAVGLTESEIRAIGAGDLQLLFPEDAAVVGYVEAFVDGAVDDEIHETVATHVDKKTIVAVAVLAGMYLGLARVIDAFCVETEEEFVGWRLEAL